jgi:DNA-directed RNA polymerase specialized sigma subunit
LEGLQLIFVELPKFKSSNFNEKKLTILWLRFLYEIKKGEEMINEDLIKELQSVPEIAQALELTKESAYTKAELASYDKYWDNISIEKTFIADAEAKGEARGEAKGELKKTESLVCNLKSKKNMDVNDIADVAEISVEQVIEILNKFGIF